MKLVITRVLKASVEVEGAQVSQIDSGLLIFVGFEEGDSEADMATATYKVAHGRFFENEKGKPHYSAVEIKRPVLLVSQFTLCADLKEGRRPDFTKSMKAQQASLFYEKFTRALQKEGLEVACGVFGAYMKVSSINDGPFTLVWSS